MSRFSSRRKSATSCVWRMILRPTLEIFLRERNEMEVLLLVEPFDLEPLEDPRRERSEPWDLREDVLDAHSLVMKQVERTVSPKTQSALRPLRVKAGTRAHLRRWPSLRTSNPARFQCSGAFVVSSSNLIPSSTALFVLSNAAHRRSETTPTARPSGVRRRSALSGRSETRYSEREVNMRSVLTR
mgnify:FL=1